MSARRLAVLTAVLAGVQLLAVLDGLAASLALPAMSRDLDLGPASRAWVLNATSVSLAGGLLVAGRLGDVLGRRPVFLAGIGLLGAGSVVAALAPDAAVLLAGRVVLGLGAAVAYPSALALTGTLFAGEPWRTRAFAAAAVSGALGALGGAAYGGAVTGWLGWRWVFWLTVPVTVALLVAASAAVPRDETAPGRRRTLDLPGAALATVAMALFVGAVIGVGTASMSWPVAAGGVVLALVATAVLVRHERRVHDALLPRRVLASARLQAGCGGIAASSALWTVVVFVLSQQLQQAGRGAGEAALAILPCSGGIVVGGTLVVPSLRRWVGSLRTAIGGLVAGSVSVGWLATLPEQIGTLWPVMPPLALLGVALSAVSTGLKENTLKRAPHGAEAVSAAVFESSTHVGGALAVATYATLLAVGGPSQAYVAAAVLGLAGAGVVVRRGLGGHGGG